MQSVHYGGRCSIRQHHRVRSRRVGCYESAMGLGHFATSDDTKTFQRYVHIQDVSTTDTDTLLDENDLKATKTTRTRNEYRSLRRMHYRPVVQERERDQTTAEMH